MNKGIIVVDEMPGNCRNIRGDENGCPYGGMVCQITKEDVMEHVNNRTKPDWCPIKKLPDRWEVCGRYPQPGKPEPSYRIGWNACLNEIEGN